MILGNKHISLFFEKAIKADSLSHAYLFSGIKGVGKHTLAREIATRVLNTENIEAHPDVLFIEPYNENIGIDTIRSVKRFISLTPVGKYKIVIVNNAHQLTREASNAFLKVLEEPQGRSLIILITDLPEMLLPTIVSRTINLRFKPIKADELKKFIITSKFKTTSIEIDEIIRLANGSFSRAIELINDPRLFLENKRELLKLIKSSLSERFNASKSLSVDRKILKDKLYNWLWISRESILSENKKTSFDSLSSLLQLHFIASEPHLNPHFALDAWMLKI
ncbi:MAG: AAA family ATPase [Parcubacteria group bacterium]|nr:AAA family ATPase [Parcubacteria group bacterium]